MGTVVAMVRVVSPNRPLATPHQTEKMASPLRSKPVDWEAVERDYRAGIYSVREIGRLHKTSHQAIGKRAKHHDWRRDLKARVRAATKKALENQIQRGGVRGGEEENGSLDTETCHKPVDGNLDTTTLPGDELLEDDRDGKRDHDIEHDHQHAGPNPKPKTGHGEPKPEPEPGTNPGEPVATGNRDEGRPDRSPVAEGHATVTDSPPDIEAEIVAATSRTQVEVVRSHQKGLAKAYKVCEALFNELLAGTKQADRVEDLIEVLTADDDNSTRRNALMRQVALGARSGSMRQLAASMRDIVTMERRAFGIEDEGDAGGDVTPIEERLAAYAREEAIAKAGDKVVSLPAAHSTPG